jgi:hypothetical protein
MPWQVTLIVKEGAVNLEGLREMSLNSESFKKINKYDITPIFLSDVNTYAKTLAERIKFDVIDTIQLLGKG